jgi:hypothetical protein
MYEQSAYVQLIKHEATRKWERYVDKSILNLGTKLKLDERFIPGKNPRYSLYRSLAEPQSRSGQYRRDELSCPCLESNPVRSQTPYRLSQRVWTARSSFRDACSTNGLKNCQDAVEQDMDHPGNLVLAYFNLFFCIETKFTKLKKQMIGCTWYRAEIL